MAVAVAVSIEGVLAAHEPGTSFGASQPVRPGIRLIQAMAETYKVILLTQEVETRPVEHWLKQQALSDFYGLLLPRRAVELEFSYEDLRAAQIAYLKGCGFNVEMVIDTDPAVIHNTIQGGTSAMLFAHPTYLRPEFRPDDSRGQRAWADIEEEVTHQALLKAGDVRLTKLYEESAEAEIEDEEKAR